MLFHLFAVLAVYFALVLLIEGIKTLLQLILRHFFHHAF